MPAKNAATRYSLLFSFIYRAAIYSEHWPAARRRLSRRAMRLVSISDVQRIVWLHFICMPVAPAADEMSSHHQVDYVWLLSDRH